MQFRTSENCNTPIWWSAGSPPMNLSKLPRKLKQMSNEIVIESHVPQRGKGDQNVPVLLKNRGLFGAFQPLVTTYGKPRYEEVDPTILLAITFPLLFGAMFGDVGHGLILALLGRSSGKREGQGIAQHVQLWNDHYYLWCCGDRVWFLVWQCFWFGNLAACPLAAANGKYYEDPDHYGTWWCGHS